jgi:hypothetical protein
MQLILAAWLEGAANKAGKIVDSVPFKIWN